MNGNSIEQVMTETRTRMRKSVEDLSRELATVRTGRASLHLFDPIRVDYYGTLTPLNQLATLHVAEAEGKELPFKRRKKLQTKDTAIPSKSGSKN